jgi:hypothetical protein
MKTTIKTTLALMQWAGDVETGHEIDAVTLQAQMGKMNVLAISGGRCMKVGSTAIFPVSNGYHVAVTLTAGDDYTVSRVYVRGGKAMTKAQVTGIYAEMVGEVAYQMSCFENAA